jgi:plastocyanin
MMKKTALAALLTIGLGTWTGEAAAATVPVAIQFGAFAPSSVDVLPGDVVTWMNHGGRTHTVTADDGQFDSGDLPDGAHFTQTFTAVGAYPYHCALHPRMTGEVNVRRVTLEPLPSRLVTPNSTITLAGRTADPLAPVRIEQDAGTGFQMVATVSPQADGTWRARLVATKTATLRAVSGQDASQTRQLQVIARTVRVRATRSGISVAVIPGAPYARVSLQLLLPNRFGWWPVASKRLNYLSRTSFALTGPARARVALVDRDGWTALAISRIVRVHR